MNSAVFQRGPEITQNRADCRERAPAGGAQRSVIAAAARLLWLAAALCAPLSAAADELKVKLSFTGVEDSGLEKKLEQASRLTGDDKKTVESVAGLRRIADNDRARLEAVLRSEGYYTPVVDFEVSGAAPAYRLTYQIETGQKFRITDYVIKYEDEIDNGRPVTLQAAGLEPDGSPRGEDIAALQKGLLTYLQDNGFPAARIADRKVEAAPATGNATLRFTVESGPPSVYGDVKWSGLGRTKEDYVDRFVPWTQGTQFQLKELTKFRDSLAKSELFTSIQVEPGTPGPEGVTPVNVEVTERPPRTVGVGVSYSTNFGPGGRVFWEHRNLFGRAEKLHAEINIAQIKQFGLIGFRKPRAAERGVWFLRLEGGNEDSDAFSGINAVASAGLERKVGEHWLWSAALAGEWSDFEDAFGQRQTTLGSVPLRAVFDNTDNVLNPTKGFKIATLITPAVGFSPDVFQFTTFELKGAGHVPFDEKGNYIAALWGRAGATLGAPNGEIPANHRFYAGGAGSVRGYGYQLLGPLDENNDPVGGRSVIEGGVEFRVKFTKSIGMVTFIEGGSAFASGFPDLNPEFNDKIRFGAGLGFRYYTSLGPVRLDVAVPLEKREGVDDDFQFYISLGQAF